jgi:hypothetical protein
MTSTPNDPSESYPDQREPVSDEEHSEDADEVRTDIPGVDPDWPQTPRT